MRFLRRGADAFSPEAHYRQTGEGAVAPAADAAASAPFWILARSQYRVKPLSLQHVAANRREAAVKLELAAWTPFARTAHYVVPQPDGALLLAWDGDQVEAAMASLGVAGGETPVVPETAWRAPAGDGVMLYQCLEGMEAIAGANGNVQACLWWRELPGEQEWLNFLRTSGLDSAQRIPRPATPVAAAWLSQALGYAAGQRSLQLAGKEIGTLAVASFLLALATLWYANDWRRHAAAQADSEQRLKVTEQELDGLLGARGTALSALSRLEKLEALFNRPDALSLLAIISRQLATVAKPGTLQLAELDWRDQRIALVLTVNGTAPPATLIVKALEEVPAFRDVQVTPEGNRTRVELRIGAGAPRT